MNSLCFTLITDGSSDKALIPIIHWLLSQRYPNQPLDGEWANLARLPFPPKSLAQKILVSCNLHPCDILFIHRDAEKEPRDARVTEIQQAVEEARAILATDSKAKPLPCYVCVIPVRMLEAWLLFDLEGIRKAAANPNGTIALQLPPLNRLESLVDPKEKLYQLLRSATERSGRMLKKFKPQTSVHRLAEDIDDFSPLRDLPAFRAFEKELLTLLVEWRLTADELSHRRHLHR